MTLLFKVILTVKHPSFPYRVGKHFLESPCEWLEINVGKIDDEWKCDIVYHEELVDIVFSFKDANSATLFKLTWG